VVQVHLGAPHKSKNGRYYHFFGNKGELGVFGVAGSGGGSSVGRTPDLHSGGQGFDSLPLHHLNQH
tara:strand:- start:532 stop:729 length:198 start_codon:yes stop_codon:yes gene_type:complete